MVAPTTVAVPFDPVRTIFCPAPPILAFGPVAKAVTATVCEALSAEGGKAPLSKWYETKLRTAALSANTDAGRAAKAYYVIQEFFRLI